MDNVSVILVKVGKADPAALVGGVDEDDELGPEPDTVGDDGDERPTGEETGPSLDVDDVECSTPSRDGDSRPGKKPGRSTGEYNLPSAKKRPAVGDVIDAHRGKILLGLALLFIVVVYYQISQLKQGPSGPRGFVEGLEDFAAGDEGEVLVRRRQVLPVAEPEVVDPQEALNELERSLSGAGAAPDETSEAEGPAEPASGDDGASVETETDRAPEVEALEAEAETEDEAVRAAQALAEAEAADRQREAEAEAGREAYGRAVEELRGTVDAAADAGGADPAGLEEAMASWQALTDARFEGVEPDRRLAVEAELKTGILDAGSAYLEAERARIVARLEAGDEPGDSWASLEAFPERAPILAGMLTDTYQEAREAVEHARRTRHGKAVFAQVLERFDQVRPERIVDETSLEAAESAARVLTDARARSWEGVSEEERNRHLDQREAGLEAVARAHLEGLRERALARYADGEDGEPEYQALKELPTRAPALSDLVESARAEAEAAVARQAETYQGIADFQSVLARIRAAAPESIEGMNDLARAEAAAVALAAMDDRIWAGVSDSEVQAAREEIRAPLAERLSGYVGGLRDQATEAYARGEDADPLRRRLLSLQERAPTAAALASDALNSALAVVDEARAEKLAGDAARAEEQARQQAEAEARAASIRAAEAAEAADRARAEFPERVQEALEGGTWGAFGAYMDSWSEALEPLAAESGREQGIAAWRRTWEEARDRPEDVPARLQAVWDAVAEISREAGVPVPPAIPALPDDPAARADAYCAARYRLQQRAHAPLDSADALRLQVGLWGDRPEAVLTALFAMCGSETAAADAKALAGRLVEAADALRGVSSDQAIPALVGPAPVDTLRGAPLPAVARAESACDQVWDQVYTSAAGPLLDQIDRGLVYGGFMGLDLNQDEHALRAVEALEDSVFDLIEARAALPQDTSVSWWRRLDSELLGTVVERLRELDAMIP